MGFLAKKRVVYTVSDLCFTRGFTYFADMTGASFIIFIFLFASGTNEFLL